MAIKRAMVGLPENWKAMSVEDRQAFLDAKAAKKDNVSRETSAEKSVPKNDNVSRETSGKKDQHFYQKQIARDDYNALKSVQDHAERDRRKPSLVNKFKEYLQNKIKSNDNRQDDCLFLNLVWALDIGDWDWALTLADYAVAINQETILLAEELNLPKEPFVSNVATVLSDNARIYAQSLFDENPTHDLPQIFLELIKRFDNKNFEVNSISKSKALRLMGESHHAQEDFEQAVSCYEHALSLNKKVGVVKLLKQAKTLI